MEFFEVLRDSVAKKLHSPYATFEDLDPRNHKYINATIEVLKEMMVGDSPLDNQLRHDEGQEYHGHPILDPSNFSWIPITILENEVVVCEGIHIGTDGEEVIGSLTSFQFCSKIKF